MVSWCCDFRLDSLGALKSLNNLFSKKYIMKVSFRLGFKIKKRKVLVIEIEIARGCMSRFERKFFFCLFSFCLVFFFLKKKSKSSLSLFKGQKLGLWDFLGLDEFFDHRDWCLTVAGSELKGGHMKKI